MTKAFAIQCVFLLVAACAGADPVDFPFPNENIFLRRYAMVSLNWQDSAQVQQYKTTLARIANLGYNAVVVNSGGMFHLEHQKQSWFQNFEQIRAEAARLGIPLLLHHGVQRIPTYHDRNLGEAFPVKGTPFKVKGKEAFIESDFPVQLQNGGFEAAEGAAPANWRLQRLAPGSGCVLDQATRYRGNTSVRIENPAYGAALYQTISVKPFRAYRVTLWIKTADYSLPNQVAIGVKASGSWLLYIRHASAFGWGNNAVRETQNWKKSEIDFNSREHSAVSIYVRPTHMAGPATGTIWFDEIHVEEVGLYEAVRRPSAPVKVKSAATDVTYTETKDYVLSIKADFRYQGRLTLPDGSAIQDGESLVVDWYQFANIDHYHAPAAAGCIQAYYDALEKDAIRINQMFGGLKGVHIGIGEWREAFWDPTCISQYATAGAYMAGVAQRSRDLYRKLNPAMEIAFKNDMYDPHHNARSSYYSVNGSLLGSWYGITQDTYMWNWRPPNGTGEDDLAYKSMMFFGGQDSVYRMTPVRQLVRINGDGNVADLPVKLAHLAVGEAKGLRGVIGILYNTWYNNYATLERTVQLCKSAGRWASNPWFPPSHAGIRRQEGSRASFVSLPVNVVPRPGGGMTLRYTLKREGRVSIRVYEPRGRMVKELLKGKLSAGMHSLCWDDPEAAAGVYLVSFSFEGYGQNAVRSVRKAVVIQ